MKQMVSLQWMGIEGLSNDWCARGWGRGLKQLPSATDLLPSAPTEACRGWIGSSRKARQADAEEKAFFVLLYPLLFEIVSVDADLKTEQECGQTENECQLVRTWPGMGGMPNNSEGGTLGTVCI